MISPISYRLSSNTVDSDCQKESIFVEKHLAFGFNFVEEGLKFKVCFASSALVLKSVMSQYQIHAFI